MRKRMYFGKAIPDHLKKRLSAEKELEPWIKILAWSPDVRLKIRQAIITGSLEKIDALRASAALGIDEGGCVDIQNIREVVDYIVPSPTVYYFGIGNVRYELDIITPLFATNFKVLIGVDILPSTFAEFKEAVRQNLALTMETDIKKDIAFRRVSGNEFVASFVFKGEKKRIIGIFNFDATTGCPSRLDRGYHILFTRRTGVVFSRIPSRVRRQLFDNLVANGLIIFDEQVFEYSGEVRIFSEEEFLEIDLRDYFPVDSRWLDDMRMFRFRRIFIKRS